MNPVENHKCLQCAFESQWSFAFKDHLRKHRCKVSFFTFDCSFQENFYTCEVCNFATNLKVILLQHLEIRHKLELPFNKEIFFKTEPVDTKAEIVAYNSNEFQCGCCGLKTFSRVFLMKHLERCKLRHQSIECFYEKNGCENYQQGNLEVSCGLEAKGFKCAICDFHSSYKQSLNRHYILKHANTCTWSVCSICNFKCKYKPNLMSHQRKVHGINTKVDQFANDSELKCMLCDYRAKEKGRLKRHHLVNHLPASEGKWFECIKCVYKTRRKDHLKRHYINSHMAANDRISAKSKDHISRNKTKESPNGVIQVFNCVKCEYTTKRKYDLDTHNLNNHMLDNEGEWFECASCEYKARRKNLLKRHMSKHASNDKVTEFLEKT